MLLRLLTLVLVCAFNFVINCSMVLLLFAVLLTFLMILLLTCLFTHKCK